MVRVSMPRFDDIIDMLSELKQRFVEWSEFKRRKYALKKWFLKRFRYAVDNLKGYGKAYGKYLLFEFAPFVVAYGLLFNVPASVFFGVGLTPETVVAWGFLSYILLVEAPSLFNEVKPYVRVTAKVDN